ncbi:hypothetical protein V2J09_010709 [Rumex salicifolius]
MHVTKKHCPRRVITWTLTASDVNKELVCLIISSKKIYNRFLNDWEEKLLEEREGEGQLRRLEVAVVDPMLEVRTFNLVRWNYKIPPLTQRAAKEEVVLRAGRMLSTTTASLQGMSFKFLKYELRF